MNFLKIDDEPLSSSVPTFNPQKFHNGNEKGFYSFLIF